MRLSKATALVLFAVVLAGEVCAQPHAAVLLDPQRHSDTALARDVATSIAAAGYAIQFIDVATLARAPALMPQTFALLVLPHGRTLPADSIEPVQHFLRSGGNLMALGVPLWVAPQARPSTAGNAIGTSVPPTPVAVPRLEALAPAYLFYPVSPPVEFVIPPSAGRTPARPLTAPREVLAFHPRPRGAGYDQNRPWRWEPLLSARARDGDDRGAAAVLLVHADGGAIAAFTPNDADFYRQDAVRQLLRDTAARIKRGVFLLDGGAEFYTLFADQPVRLGAQVVRQAGTSNVALTVRLTVVSAAAKAVPEFSMERAVSLPPRGRERVETSWRPTRWPHGGYVVAIELLQGETVIDRLTHSLQVWQPRAQPHFIETRDGGFWLDGRPWKAHGVNYMPSSGIGVDGDAFEYWLGPGAYDPIVIDRDLRRIRAMGMNAVSVFVYHRSLRAQHLLDFLRQCDEIGLRVNLSLRPGTPLNFRWAEMKEIIEQLRLAQNDTVFAYDLAWEPSHQGQAHQEKYNTKPWREWVRTRYGSLDAAKRAWDAAGGDHGALAITGFHALPVPSSQELSRDGPWRQRVADYRRFLDELIGPAYADARRLVRGIDPNHAVSFRMQHAGDPTHAVDPLPYDFYGLADAVDIWEPEAYGRIGDWERVKAGHFTAAYARLCDPAKPVLWAEVGNDVWDARRMAPSPEKSAFTARYVADFYRMLIDSGADGVFFWWYAGGYRLNEGSDFGVINPDGTDRLVTSVIRSEGARFLAAPEPPAPDYWIGVDRDRDARGLVGMYATVQAEYWQAIGEGKTPGVRWVKKPGQ